MINFQNWNYVYLSKTIVVGYILQICYTADITANNVQTLHIQKPIALSQFFSKSIIIFKYKIAIYSTKSKWIIHGY